MTGRHRLAFSTKHFTWLHVPKTGGTWLHEVLTDYAPKSWDVSAGPPAHVRLLEVPLALEHWNKRPERIGLPIIASVRNPWDWYVSTYFFMEQHRVNRTGGFAPPKAQWDKGHTDFEDKYSKGNTIKGFRQALPQILEDMHVNITWSPIIPQWWFLRNPDGTLGVRPVAFENLRHGMVDMLVSLGAEVTAPLCNALLRNPKKNTSGHAKYESCYDDETRKLVAKYEGWLIETFEYRFGT